MRRQTMKQPTGADTRATPTPATTARTKKSSMFVASLIYHLACEIMMMVVIMRIEGERMAKFSAE